MFVLQKQLSVLNVPSRRVAKIYRSGADIQLALPDLPSQTASAFLVLLKGAGKVQVLVGLYLTKSCRNIFYLSDVGEVSAEHADQELEAGLDFAESMGFVLDNIEFSRMTDEQQETYWKGLPICRHHAQKTVPVVESSAVKSRSDAHIEVKKKMIRAASAAPGDELVSEKKTPLPAASVQTSEPVATEVSMKTDMLTKQRVLKERLGRFLASL